MGSETKNSTKNETKERLAPLYKVLFHDDNVTTMDFVVALGKKVFSLPEARAVQVMIEVHTQGVSLVVVESFEQAEFHRDQCISLARGAGFPFCVTIEPND
jgi:ATP-dependent Clp protease adaptor protein ClpS